MKNTETGLWSCDFCGRDAGDVERMVSTPQNVAICNDCICTAMNRLLYLIKQDNSISELPEPASKGE